MMLRFARHFSETDSEDAINKKRKLEFYNALDKREHEVLRRLKEYTNFKARPFGFSKLLTYTPLHWSLPHRPPARDLIQLIKHYFPPRAETKVQVYDFGDDGATQTEIRLGDIEQGMDLPMLESFPNWLQILIGHGQQCNQSQIGLQSAGFMPHWVLACSTRLSKSYSSTAGMQPWAAILIRQDVEAGHASKPKS